MYEYQGHVMKTCDGMYGSCKKIGFAFWPNTSMIFAAVVVVEEGDDDVIVLSHPVLSVNNSQMQS